MPHSVLVLAVLACLQATPSSPAFSGAWVLDPSQSLLVEGSNTDIQLLVTETATGLTVAQCTPGSEETYSAPLNGTPKEERSASSIYVRAVRREGAALAWNVKMTRVADQASISFTERWTLSPDRNVLTILRTYPSRQVLKVFKRRK